MTAPTCPRRVFVDRELVPVRFWNNVIKFISDKSSWRCRCSHRCRRSCRCCCRHRCRRWHWQSARSSCRASSWVSSWFFGNFSAYWRFQTRWSRYYCCVGAVVMFYAHFVRRGLDRGRDADANHLLPADIFISRAGSDAGTVWPRDRSFLHRRRRCARHRCCRCRRCRCSHARRCQTRRTYATRRTQIVDQRREILLSVFQRSLTDRIEANDLLAATRLRPRHWDRSAPARISGYPVDRCFVLMRLSGRAIARWRGRVVTSTSKTSASLRCRRHGAVYEDR